MCSYYQPTPLLSVLQLFLAINRSSNKNVLNRKNNLRPFGPFSFPSPCTCMKLNNNTNIAINNSNPTYLVAYNKTNKNVVLSQNAVFPGILDQELNSKLNRGVLKIRTQVRLKTMSWTQVLQYC